jgi:energy-converting hydrogenase Eha subunit E
MMVLREIDCAAVPVGEAAVVEHLQQHVADIGVGLFHLVEQHHAVGATADGFGEAAAFLVPHVSGRARR